MLIADELAPEARDGLEALGLAVTYTPDLSVDSLPKAVGDCDILVVDRTAVTKRTLSKAPQLALVLRAGAGTDAIDVAAASELGIFVSHCPHFDAAARAEHAVGELVRLDRGREGGGLGLHGRSLGLHGDSATARHLARVASGLGMAVRVFAPDMTPSLASEAGLSLAHDAGELFRRCDFVSVHGAEPAIGAVQLAALDDGAIVLAVEGLGGLDVDALHAEVDEGRLLASVDAALVGADDEALEKLSGLDGANVSRGAAGASASSRRTAAAEVVRTLHDFLHDGTVRHAVNLETDDTAVATLVIRHTHDMAGLVAVFDVLRDEGIKALDISNLLFQGASAGSLHLRLDAVPSPGVLDRIRRHQSVLHVHQA